jgi:hypothetical protein
MALLDSMAVASDLRMHATLWGLRIRDGRPLCRACPAPAEQSIRTRPIRSRRQRSHPRGRIYRASLSTWPPGNRKRDTWRSALAAFRCSAKTLSTAGVLATPSWRTRRRSNGNELGARAFSSSTHSARHRCCEWSSRSVLSAPEFGRQLLSALTIRAPRIVVAAQRRAV